MKKDEEGSEEGTTTTLDTLMGSAAEKGALFFIDMLKHTRPGQGESTLDMRIKTLDYLISVEAPEERLLDLLATGKVLDVAARLLTARVTLEARGVSLREFRQSVASSMSADYEIGLEKDR